MSDRPKERGSILAYGCRRIPTQAPDKIKGKNRLAYGFRGIAVHWGSRVEKAPIVALGA